MNLFPGFVLEIMLKSVMLPNCSPYSWRISNIPFDKIIIFIYFFSLCVYLGKHYHFGVKAMGSYCSQFLGSEASRNVRDGDDDHVANPESAAEVAVVNAGQFSMTEESTFEPNVCLEGIPSAGILPQQQRDAKHPNRKSSLCVAINPTHVMAVDLGSAQGNDELHAKEGRGVQMSASYSSLISPKAFTALAPANSPASFVKSRGDSFCKDRCVARGTTPRGGLRPNNPLELSPTFEVLGNESIRTQSLNTPRNRRWSVEGQQNDDASHSPSSQSARVSFSSHAVVLADANDPSTTDSASTSITSFSFVLPTPVKSAARLNLQVGRSSTPSSTFGIPSTARPIASNTCPQGVKRMPTMCLVPAGLPLRSIAGSTENRPGETESAMLHELPQALSALPFVEGTVGHKQCSNDELSSPLRFVPILPEVVSHRNQLAKKGHQFQ